MALPPFTPGERMVLESPYGQLLVQYSPAHRDVWRIPNGTFGTVVTPLLDSGRWVGTDAPFIQFDEYPMGAPVPRHWLRRIQETSGGQLELPIGDYYEVSVI